MTLQDNAYAAFLLDYAVGSLAPAERLVADVHVALSAEGRAGLSVLEAVGGRMLEAHAEAPIACVGDAPPDETIRPLRSPQISPEGYPDLVGRLLSADLTSLPWRRNWFGIGALSVGVPDARLLRLDPRQRAPQHGHSRRDVTVVIHGAFADEYGVYERGDLAFAEPGVKHEPRAVGDTPCICLIATERATGWRAPFRVSRAAARPLGLGPGDR